MTALTRSYWIEASFERRQGWDGAVYPFNLPAVRSLHSLDTEHYQVTRNFPNRRETMLDILLKPD